MNRGFFDTLPELKPTDADKADIAWFVYDLVKKPNENLYALERVNTVYTRFGEALDKITRSEPGDIGKFMELLQDKVDAKLNPPDTSLIKPGF
ncbi:MAG: hypothetical protein BroJett001_32550 [Chloroflexota bacterium]|nr:MAG: hypothetical protein BroJett001_32550 [Chloroflexota bacterium]